MKPLMMMIAVVLSLSGCVSGAPTGGNGQPAGHAVDFGRQTLSLINAYRTSSGLPPLDRNATMEALARQHSRSQASRGSMDHLGFRDRVAQSRSAGLGGTCTENVAVGPQDAAALFAIWRNSRAHNTNMLRPNIRVAGVSVAGSYATFFACG